KKNFRSELHFAEFKKLGVIDYYLDIIKFSLDLVECNIYIVDNDFALNLSKKLKIQEEDIRKLFYMKIPERLIYGMTRYLDTYKEIDIYIDEFDGYGNKNSCFLDEKDKCDIERIINKNIDIQTKVKKIDNLISKKYNRIHLVKTLKSQLNAQSLYRNLNYKVLSSKQEDSKNSIGLQIIDIIVGIFAFLFEEKYLETPIEIKGELLEEKISTLELNEEEKELIFKSYEKINNEYKKIIQIEDLDTQDKLKQINKKLKIYDPSNIAKSELIYRLLLDDRALRKIHNINIFRWPSNENNEIENDWNCTVSKTYISEYISLFFNFKIQFDNDNIKDILKFHNSGLDDKKFFFSDYRNVLRYPSRLSKLVERYLLDLGIVWKDM
ncbi:TPA: DUF3800 domain-containing protein, partial [Clostridioides difficile]|nr:DUF3800 domain-containing protein [Clostridioides difficile]